MTGIVFYPFMPVLGSGAFFLGRSARRQADPGSIYRRVATGAMVVGILQVVVSFVVTAVVAVAFLTS